MARKRKDRAYYDAIAHSIGSQIPIESPSSSNSTLRNQVLFNNERIGSNQQRNEVFVETEEYVDEWPERARVPAPPQRTIRYSTANPGVNPTIRTALYKGIPLLSERQAMFRHEIDYFTDIDETVPLLENLSKAVKEDKIDIGECGLIILKYKTCGKFNEEVYNSCAKFLSSFNLTTFSDGSSLGKMSRDVFQLGQIFYMKIQQHKMPFKKEIKPVDLFLKPKFTHVIRAFNGEWPFKTHQFVTTAEIQSVPDDIRRGISLVIRQVLAQILEDPRGHQSFALRFSHGKNGKKEALQDLPRNVTEFLKDFCLLSFGYPPASRFASFTYDDLLNENSSLGRKLGETRQQGLINFPQLQEDVQQFMVIVMEKIQRILNDLRSSLLQDVVYDVGGEPTTVKEFVQENNAGKLKKPSPKKLKTML
uniref:Rho-GAP domain-containing protein n=1 Tax=Caenorhabditis tropicalis TaxID=1561998 RepID=A0A1I7TQD1_9PELO